MKTSLADFVATIEIEVVREPYPLEEFINF
jgi:hypothetical protein